MSQTELATLIGVTQQRVSQLAQAGTFQVMANGKINPFIAVGAYVRELKRDDGMGRIRAAKAIEIETRNAKDRNELVSIEDVNFALSGIINVFCGELHGVAAASTRDLGLRENIQTNLNGAIERCKRRLGAMAADAAAGRPIGDDDTGGDDGED